jgi:hypothetical protein
MPAVRGMLMRDWEEICRGLAEGLLYKEIGCGWGVIRQRFRVIWVRHRGRRAAVQRPGKVG